jgi:uncharacterized Zn finger protein (UPF0148 family)
MKVKPPEGFHWNPADAVIKWRAQLGDKAKPLTGACRVCGVTARVEFAETGLVACAICDYGVRFPNYRLEIIADG